MSLKVVAAGIDSLYIGFGISEWNLDETVFKQLDDKKSEAGGTLFGGKGTTIQLAGSEFNLLPKGTKGYEYVMYNEDLRLCLARNCQGGRVFPEVMAEFNSSYLWGKGYNKAYHEFNDWLSQWAKVKSEKVNRVDLCLDLEAKLPVIDVKREVVSRLRKKTTHFEGEKHTDGIHDSGYRFGKGALVARIYDKRAELIKSKKIWLEDGWKYGGWDGKSDVTRIEGQFRRTFLREMSVNSYQEMTERIADIWRVFTTECLIIKEANPNDSNHRRWETSPFWKTAQAAGTLFGECLGVQRWKPKQERIEPLMAQMKGLMVSEVALDSTIRGDYFAKGRLRQEINLWLESEEFRIKVLKRRGRYANLKSL
jgi:hypothetical protein